MKRHPLENLLIFILVLIISGLIVFSAYTTDWNYYRGKNVSITMISGRIYEGKVLNVFEIEFCKQYDNLPTPRCVYYEYIYTMNLQIKEKEIMIPCEKIIRIEEIK